MRTETQLTRLMNWLTPIFPVGGYAYSGGLEFAVADGLVTDRAQLVGWIRTQITAGTGWLDAVFLHLVYEAVANGDAAGFAELVTRADIMRATSEGVLETRAQGRAFLDAVTKSWSDAGLAKWAEIVKETGREPVFPVAVALATALAGIAEPLAMHGFVHGVSTNLVSAGMRLIPLGQASGQAAIAALEAGVAEIADQALRSGRDDLHTAAPIIEWAGMRHETQYTRLFRT